MYTFSNHSELWKKLFYCGLYSEYIENSVFESNASLAAQLLPWPKWLKRPDTVEKLYEIYTKHREQDRSKYDLYNPVTSADLYIRFAVFSQHIEERLKRKLLAKLIHGNYNIHSCQYICILFWYLGVYESSKIETIRKSINFELYEKMYKDNMLEICLKNIKSIPIFSHYASYFIKDIAKIIQHYAI